VIDPTTSASPGTLDAAATRVTRVTLFEDRAEIVRSAKVPVGAGATWVRLAGMTPFLDDRSVQARVEGGAARVSAARVVRRVFHEQTEGHVAREALEAGVRAAGRRLQAARAAAERARAGGEHARDLATRWVAGLVTTPRGIARQSSSADGPRDRVASWRASYEAVVAAEREALVAASRARADEVKAHDEVVAADARLRAAYATRVRHEAVVEVRVESEDATEVEIVVTYRSPGALWRPEHRVHAVTTTDAATARLEIVTWGTVWQATGEDWKDVELHLSTARPAHHATAPLVADDLLLTRRKSDEERRQVIVEGREQEIVRAGAEGARAVDEMPGVDDGGVPLVYAATSRAHVAPDGRPVRVEVERRVIDARVDCVAYPELDAVAHHRARGLLAGGPLLAGPAHVSFDGVAAGRALVKFVGGGEPFEIGLGTDDAVRVRRATEAQDDTTALMGTQLRKRTVVIWVSNLSALPRRVRVIERVPVSEIEGLEVSFSSTPEWRFDAKDGFAHRDVDLPANASVKIRLVYEIRAAAKIVLPAAL